MPTSTDGVTGPAMSKRRPSKSEQALLRAIALTFKGVLVERVSRKEADARWTRWEAAGLMAEKSPA